MFRRKPVQSESPWMPEERASLFVGDKIETTLTYEVTVDGQTLVGKKRMLLTLESAGPGGAVVVMQRERSDRRAPSVIRVEA